MEEGRRKEEARGREERITFLSPYIFIFRNVYRAVIYQTVVEQGQEELSRSKMSTPQKSSQSSFEVVEQR